MKVCTKCGSEKPFEEFHKQASRPDGLQPACKACMNIAYNTSRKKKQEHYQAVAANRYAKNTARIREWKSEQGCKLCNETYAQCLELHHLDPTEKDFDPADGAVKSWETFMKEAAKCVVLCANCHRKVHGGVLVV